MAFPPRMNTRYKLFKVFVGPACSRVTPAYFILLMRGKPGPSDTSREEDCQVKTL